MAQMVGQDGYYLLEHIFSSSNRPWLRDLPAVTTFRQVWVQEFYREDDQVICRTEQNSPPTGQEICSPHEPEARYGRKRDARWIGYKVHLTETCSPDSPNLITHVETTLGSVSDVVMLSTVHEQLAHSERKPKEHLVDAGYVTSDTLVESWESYQVRLVGPVRANPSPQAATHSQYDVTQFHIDWEREQVICPQGHPSRRWRYGTGVRGKPNVLVEFHSKDCRACPVRSQCILGEKATQRNLTFQRQAAFEALHEARQHQQDVAFRKQYAKRSGIEGTISQAVFVLGMRRARYRGQQKVHLQHVLTATAINLSRTFHWQSGTPRSRTRKSAFACLVA
jgi:transposase